MVQRINIDSAGLISGILLSVALFDAAWFSASLTIQHYCGSETSASLASLDNTIVKKSIGKQIIYYFNERSCQERLKVHYVSLSWRRFSQTLGAGFSSSQMCLAHSRHCSNSGLSVERIPCGSVTLYFPRLGVSTTSLMKHGLQYK